MTGKSLLWVVLSLLLTVSYCNCAKDELTGPASGENALRVVMRFIPQFEQATKERAVSVEVSKMARSLSVVIPSLFMHPTDEGDTIVSFNKVQVPRLLKGERAFVRMRIAMSDGIGWGGERNPNGVRFMVCVNGEMRLCEEVAEAGWKWRFVDVTDCAGKTAQIEFKSNAIDSNLAYDWALMGDPDLVVFNGTVEPRALSPQDIGFAVVPVEATGNAQVQLVLGEHKVTVPVGAGKHWLPLRFTKPEVMQANVVEGDATVGQPLYAPFEYSLQAGLPEASVPLITAGQMASVILPLKNQSEGASPANDNATLEITGPDKFRQIFITHMPVILPGVESAVCWRDIEFMHPGEYLLKTRINGLERVNKINVLPPEPQLVSRPEMAEVKVLSGLPRVGVAQNPWSRIVISADTRGDAYALADTWNGTSWQRMGAIYPLAKLVLSDNSGQRVEAKLQVESLTQQGRRLMLRGSFVVDEQILATLRLTLEPARYTPRIKLDASLVANDSLDVIAFTAPTVLAGAGSFGAQKDFAVFPGLEYLEGAEASSSKRDLAPPLHDRSVPVAGKIACPLMAVQGNNGLIALLWDMQQEWAQGQRLPAARFDAPAEETGRERIDMALIAPSVGKWLPENQTEAATPYPLPAGAKIRLQSVLVLEHKTNYDATSVVNSGFDGGLITQAVRHWYEIFGLPEPSAQPRSWNEQRAFMREAYLKTLWSEQPPGWPSLLGAAVEYDTEPFGALLLEKRAGLDAAMQADIDTKLAQVSQRVVQDKGPETFLQGNRIILPFAWGYLGKALPYYKTMGLGMLRNRTEGLWVWEPDNTERAALGIPGTHTLGQAAYPSLVATRAARFSGDEKLQTEALAAIEQLDLYEVPRGASMWECPQYQPDIFAAALTIKALCEAYKLTGDRAYVEKARYWAWTGLQFIYTWSLKDYPTMLYNSVGVIGSTYYTHSWIGRPVVWMGLDYAYALQDLAEFDDSFDWRKIAQGITTSAMWQQYTDEKRQGLYPDSWEMATNTPNPVEIPPTLIALNEYRLRGESLEVRTAGVTLNDVTVRINSSADITLAQADENVMWLQLKGSEKTANLTAIAQVEEPINIKGTGFKVSDDAALQSVDEGWIYNSEIKTLIIKSQMKTGGAEVEIHW